MKAYEYIHEYDILDNQSEFMAQMESTCEAIYGEYEAAMRRAKQTIMFESGGDELYLEAEQGFFAKVGMQVEKLIKRIKEFIDKMLNLINPMRKKAQDQQDQMKELLRKNPDIGKKVIEGVADGSISVKDLDQLIKTTNSLTTLLENDKLSEQQYNDKMQVAFDDFDKKTKKVASGINSVAAAVAIVGTVLTLITTVGKNMDSIKKMSENYKARYERQQTKTPSKARASLNALLKVETKAEQQYGYLTSILGKLSSIMGKFTNKNVLTDTIDKMKGKQDEKLVGNQSSMVFYNPSTGNSVPYPNDIVKLDNSVVKRQKMSDLDKDMAEKGFKKMTKFEADKKKDEYNNKVEAQREKNGIQRSVTDQTTKSNKAEADRKSNS